MGILTTTTTRIHDGEGGRRCTAVWPLMRSGVHGGGCLTRGSRSEGKRWGDGYGCNGERGIASPSILSCSHGGNGGGGWGRMGSGPCCCFWEG